MKRMIGAMMFLWVLLAAVPAYALLEEECFNIYGGDYYISFVLSTFSGKVIDDGYLISSTSLRDFNPGTSFDFCGVTQGSESTDSFFGEVFDLQDRLAYLKSEGAIIWDSSFSKAYLQGGYDNGITSGYIDGTIKCSKGKCSLTAKGGINNYSSFIVSYTAIKGSGILVSK